MTFAEISALPEYAAANIKAADFISLAELSAWHDACMAELDAADEADAIAAKMFARA